MADRIHPYQIDLSFFGSVKDQNIKSYQITKFLSYLFGTEQVGLLFKHLLLPILSDEHCIILENKVKELFSQLIVNFIPNPFYLLHIGRSHRLVRTHILHFKFEAEGARKIKDQVKILFEFLVVSAYPFLIVVLYHVIHLDDFLFW